jgi:hypothetical protein
LQLNQSDAILQRDLHLEEALDYSSECEASYPIRIFSFFRMCGTIVHTVQVQHLHLAQFGLAGPTLALKVQGACHTLSATSLSEVALRRTCTESIRKKSTLKTALTKKKTKFALSTLGVIYFLIYLPNYRKKMLQRRPRQPLLPHPIMMLRSLRMMS